MRFPLTAELRAVLRAADDEDSRPRRSTGVMVPFPIAAPAEMVIISIEEWTTSFAVRWWFRTGDPSPEIDLRLQDGLQWSALDDRRATYLGGDFGGGGGNSPRWVATAMFAPALPTDWATLELRVTSPLGGEHLTTYVARSR